MIGIAIVHKEQYLWPDSIDLRELKLIALA